MVPAASKIIVCAPSSLVGQWAAEFRKWLGTSGPGGRLRTAVVNVGGAEAAERVRDFTRPYEETRMILPVLIISYDMYRKHATVLNASSIDLLICDEGHRLKNIDGNATINALSAVPTPRRVILTGTPVQNDLEEFVALINFVAPGTFNTSGSEAGGEGGEGGEGSFKRVYQECIEAGQYRDATDAQRLLGTTRAAELREIASRYVLRRTNALLRGYLPPKTQHVVFCSLTAMQVHIYRHLVERAQQNGKQRGAGRRGGIVSDPLSLISDLTQLCSHPDILYRRCRQRLLEQEDAEEAEGAEGAEGGKRSSGGGGGRKAAEMRALMTMIEAAGYTPSSAAAEMAEMATTKKGKKGKAASRKRKKEEEEPIDVLDARSLGNSLSSSRY